MKIIKDIVLALILIAIFAIVYSYASSRKPDIFEPKDVSGTVSVPVGETGVVGNVKITLKEVVQDSRCPIDVVCIEGGAITAKVVLLSGSDKEERNIASDDVPYEFGRHQISIVEVEPAPYSGRSIEADDYEVTFKVNPFTRISYACDEGKSMVVTDMGDAVHLKLYDRVGGERQYHLSEPKHSDHRMFVRGDEIGLHMHEGGFYVTEGPSNKKTFSRCVESK